MIKKLTGFVAIVAFVAVAAPTMTGCSKKASCKNVCEKMKKCSDAFAEVAGKGMPKAAMEMMKKTMKKQFADTDACIKKCKKDKTSKDDKKLNKCMGKSDCKAFAECFMKAVKESKK